MQRESQVDKAQASRQTTQKKPTITPLPVKDNIPSGIDTSSSDSLETSSDSGRSESSGDSSSDSSSSGSDKALLSRKDKEREEEEDMLSSASYIEGSIIVHRPDTP